MAMTCPLGMPSASQAARLSTAGSTRGYSRWGPRGAKAASSFAPVVRRIFPRVFSRKRAASSGESTTMQPGGRGLSRRSSRSRGTPAASAPWRMFWLASLA